MTALSEEEAGLYTDAVTMLTQAATRRDSHGGPRDFADFLAHVLAATAANVGGPDQLLAGRPGSWEASYVDGLIRGTMGSQPEDWCWYRTQPVVVPLNVAELIEDEVLHPGLMGLGEALETFDRDFDPIAGDPDTDAWDHGLHMITTRYTEQYQLYAQRFTLAATLFASQIPGLTADVHVEADTDPNSHWWSGTATTNPHNTNDPLVQQLWCAAHDTTPLPDIDIWLRVADKIPGH